MHSADSICYANLRVGWYPLLLDSENQVRARDDTVALQAQTCHMYAPVSVERTSPYPIVDAEAE